MLRSVDKNQKNGDAMKGTDARPKWPAPAETAFDSKPKTHNTPSEPLSRVALALLDEYSIEGAHGYDPYNANGARRAVAPGTLRRRSKA